VALGFSVPDTQGVPSHESFSREVLQRVIGDMVAAGGFRLYLARLHGELAGAGTLRLHEEVAQLCGASTLPTQRLRGVQTALLERRLLEAGAAGSNIAVVTTQPGSKSQENVQKQGFGILYTRAVFELVN
jgi:hypothetical protein